MANGVFFSYSGIGDQGTIHWQNIAAKAYRRARRSLRENDGNATYWQNEAAHYSMMGRTAAEFRREMHAPYEARKHMPGSSEWYDFVAANRVEASSKGKL